MRPSAQAVRLSERDRAVLRGFAARVDPNDAGAHNNLGVLYYNKGMLDEAVAAFTRALAIDPRMATAERNLHIAWRETGLFDRAVADLARNLQTNPADQETRRQLADALLLAGEADRAIPHYETLVAATPGDAHALGQLARACKRRGDLDSANAWIRRALEQRPNDDAFRLLLAELSYHRGLSDDSLIVLRDLAERRPDDADVQYLLGFVLGDLGFHAEGAEAARRALRLNPSLGRAEANLSLERRGDAPAAPPEPEPAPVPGGALAHFNLGLAFRQKGYHAQALKEYELALQKGEDRALVTQAMAEVHLLKQDGASATRLYEKLVKEQADSPKLWNERGVALHQSGRAADALLSYERSVALDGNYALALNNLGVAQFHAGRDDLAVEAFRRALTLQPSFVKARLNLALLLLKRRESHLCLEAYRQVLRLEPEHPVAWNGVGLVLSEMKQFEDARNAFGRAIDERPDYAEAHYNLSFTLSNLGDFEGALRETKRALELNPYYVAQKFELAIDLEYEDPDLSIQPDLGAEHRAEENVEDFAFDAGVLDSLFTTLAPGQSDGTGDAEKAGQDAYAMASDYLAMGLYDRAAAEVSRALARGASRVDGYLLLGDLYARQGAHGEALDRYREAKREAPNTFRPAIGEATALLAMGRGSEARPIAEAMLSAGAPDIDVLMLVAAARAATGDPAAALNALEQARRLAPLRANVHQRTGDIAASVGDFDGAIAAYRHALELDQDYAVVRFQLARLLRGKGMLREAEAE